MGYVVVGIISFLLGLFLLMDSVVKADRRRAEAGLMVVDGKVYRLTEIKGKEVTGAQD